MKKTIKDLADRAVEFSKSKECEKILDDAFERSDKAKKELKEKRKVSWERMNDPTTI